MDQVARESGPPVDPHARWVRVIHWSARTVHFFASAALVLFVLVHVVMVVAPGFTRQIRGMTVGR